MQIESIGVITVLLGLIVLYAGPRLGIFVLAGTTLLGSAAALQLPALGGASVPPVALILIFFAVTLISYEHIRSAVLPSLAYPGPGFWLMAIVAFGALSAFFLPRLFGGVISVFPLARFNATKTLMMQLAPRSTNVTQSLYLAGDFACFVGVCALAAREGAILVGRAMLFAAIANLAFAAMDTLTYVLGAHDVLSIIRNANYTILDASSVNGVRRIVGSFSETSAYAFATMGLFAFCFGLWLKEIWSRTAGVTAALLLATLLFSTSSTAYGALTIYCLGLYVACLARLVTGHASRREAGYLLGAPVAILVVTIAAMLIPQLWDGLLGLLDAAITNKLYSRSGVERSSWNSAGFATFLDTLGFGAGLGSIRTSSFLIAVPANLGVIGAVLYLAFFASLGLSSLRRPRERFESGVTSAATAGWLGLLVAALINAGTTDLGFLFSMFAGLSAAPAMRILPDWQPRSRANADPATAPIPNSV